MIIDLQQLFALILLRMCLIYNFYVSDADMEEEIWQIESTKVMCLVCCWKISIVHCLRGN